MTARRKFLLSSSAAAALPLLGAAPGACAHTGASAGSPVTDTELKRQMLAKLDAELHDNGVAAALQPWLLDIGFQWSLPSVAASRIERIVAYSFGNRANGTTHGDQAAVLPDPGPVNEALADAVYQLTRQRHVKVYAQWEIARFLASKYQLTNVVSIEPVTAADGRVTYLSTDGVAAAVVGQETSAAAMGVVAVVGHRDHAKRCIQTSRARGMDAYAALGLALPTQYDSQSGQAWTRRRDLYLVHDMFAQLANLRTALIAADYPNG